MLVNARVGWAGLEALAKALGWGGALRLGIKAELGPDPFAALPVPTTKREKASRAQMGSAVRLYQQARDSLGDERALEVVGRAVHAASLVFLAHAIGPLDIERYRRSDEAGRRQYLTGITTRFPNATARIEDVRDDGFVQIVERCDFVELCQQLALPELAPLFCAGDLAFFAEGEVALGRPKTLSEGSDVCEFRFGLRR